MRLLLSLIGLLPNLGHWICWARTFGKMLFCVIQLLLGLALVALLHAGQSSRTAERYYYPEYRERADATRSSTRTAFIKKTLASAAGAYRDKERSKNLGIEKTVFISVVSYGDKSYYKIYFYNLLCYARHHDIDIVVYLVHHNLPNWREEVKIYTSMGIRVIPYPDQLFWSLLSSKTSQIHKGPAGHGDYASAVPSFASHGALVMLVPVLEVLLHGYNCIFFDVDIAMVLDPVPFLTRGQADFVSSLEMRSCPDAYTPTYLNATALSHKHLKTVNSMESVNWYTIEPNTGIMSVRATEAGIGFYTEWLLRIIDVNELNDQKAMLREPHFAQYTNECVYGDTSPHRVSSAAHLKNRASKKYTHALDRPDEQRSQKLRAKWASNFTSLVEDIQLERYQRPAKFCFLSELLFQNGQTAFTCGAKPSFKDAWILEMYRNGLQKHNEDNSQHHNARQVPFDTVNTPRFAVAVHANYCDRKTHELSVRGLWLVQNDTTDAPFTATTCRAYDPYQTYYTARNWTEEYQAIVHKRNYMFETFVQPGQLIQSTNGMEVFLVDEHRHKQLIPDGETFIAKMGDNKWGDVRFLPQPLMDSVPLGNPIPSARNAPKAQAAGSATSTDAAAPPATAAYGPAVAMPDLPIPPASPADTGARPAHKPHHERQSARKHAEQVIFPGMVVRSPAAATIYYIDKHLLKRRVQNTGVYNRLFGGDYKKVIVVPDAALQALGYGEPLVL